MKTMKTILNVVIMLSIAISYADGSCRSVPNKTTAILKFSNVKKGHQYTIKDSQDAVIYTETIKRNGSFLKKFDFTSLDNGFYTFEISKDIEIIIKPFKIESQRVFFLDGMETMEFKPVVRLETNTLMISQLSLDSKPLKVELFYEGKLIYSDELKGDQVLERTFKLSNEIKGSYYLSLKSGDRCFLESFEI